MKFLGNILLKLMYKFFSTERGKWKLIQLLELLAKQQNRNSRFFISVLDTTLRGMNIGQGTYTGDSGEVFAMKYVYGKIKNNNDVVVFDVGANVGQWANALIKVFTDSKFVLHSFEPANKTYTDLCKKVNHPNVFKHNMGMGEEEGTKVLYYSDNVSTLASVVKTDFKHWKYEADKSETIQIGTIDSFCAKHGIERVHFLKIDVEGFEYPVLKGAQEMMRKNAIDYIQFEFGQNHVFSKTFFRDFYYLLNDKYTIYRILNDGLVEITRYWETNEIFLTTNFLAVLKEK